MQFFEYKDGNITPLPYPMVSRLPDDKTCFLIWAQDMADAENAANKHLNGEPFKTLENFRWTRDVTYREIESVAVGTIAED